MQLPVFRMRKPCEIQLEMKRQGTKNKQKKKKQKWILPERKAREKEREEKRRGGSMMRGALRDECVSPKLLVPDLRNREREQSYIPQTVLGHSQCQYSMIPNTHSHVCACVRKSMCFVYYLMCLVATFLLRLCKVGHGQQKCVSVHMYVCQYKQQKH